MGNQRSVGFHLFYASIFLIIATTHTCFRAVNASFCDEQERLALLKFKQSVWDEFEMLSAWVGNDCCLWKGVRCDASTRSVVSLSLTGHNIWNSYYFPESNLNDIDPSGSNEYYYPVGEDNYLVGKELNASLAELKYLKHLDLSGNDFRKSQIPEFIGSFKHLSYLNLSNAGFTGTIPPHIGNISKLEVLDLSTHHPDLVVDDLAWVFSLSLLKHLKLNGVDLAGAQNVNMVLYMIPSLVELSLSHCSLTDAHLGPYLNLSRALPNIRYLDLSNNFLRDQIPPFLQNMTTLTFLDISNSDLSPQVNLTSLLNMIPTLSELHLSRCELSNENLSPTNLNSSIRNIQHLDLSGNSIEGRFPSLLTNISSLRVLDLRRNFLNSSIPFMPNLLKLDISGNKYTDIEHVGIWRQCHMKELRVSHNYLGEEMIGVSTNISECSQYGLEKLYLDHNQLNGSIPESLSRLANLRVLDLSANRLTNMIPNSLGRLRALEVLDISSNKLNGKFPISVGQLRNLNFLNASSNSLEGIVFESHFANLSMLTYLDISLNREMILNVSRHWIPPFNLTTLQLGSCKIIDAFPGWIKTQRKLKKLVLFDTTISGPLPAWFHHMPIIPHLDLSHNNLSGPLTNLPHGDHFNGFQDKFRGLLNLQNNLFNGSIPLSLCGRTSLEVLDLSKNKLSGEIPTCLENLKNLRAMILSYNGFSGVIPSSIGNNSLLVWLHLNGNNFTRELPPDMANLYNLWALDLGNNELSGKIPEWFSELRELMFLRLHKNKFTGRIPQSLCTNECLQDFDVAENNLKGPIPHCLGSLSGMIERDHCRHYLYSKENMLMFWKGAEYTFSEFTLTILIHMDLSSNELVGGIPDELTKLILLKDLNFSNNNLTGNIPDNIGNLKDLESIDLSVNKLTGMIPQSLADIDFGYLNLSHNNLSGQIPISTHHQLQSFDPSSYAANEYLCGSPLTNICPNPTIPPTNKTGNKENNKVWFYIGVVSGFATGFWGVIGALFFNKTWRNEFYRLAGVIIDNIYVVVAVKLNKMKRHGEDI